MHPSIHFHLVNSAESFYIFIDSSSHFNCLPWFHHYSPLSKFYELHSSHSFSFCRSSHLFQKKKRHPFWHALLFCHYVSLKKKGRKTEKKESIRPVRQGSFFKLTSFTSLINRYPVQAGDTIWMAPFVPQWYDHYPHYFEKFSILYRLA